MILTTNCGVVIDGTTLKTIGGVLTLDTNDTVTNVKNHSICGGLQYDGDAFKVVGKVLTLKSDIKTSITDYSTCSCSMLVDNDYFTITNGKLSCGTFDAIVTFDVTPDDATITVTDGDLEEIDANEDGTYTISCNEEYSYSVSKTDYITQSGTINTNKNKTIEVTLIVDEG